MKRLIRWLGIGVGLLALLVALLAVGIYFRSEAIVNQVYAAPTSALTISTATDAIARGEHLANYVSVCVDCHGANLEGGIVVDDPALGRIVAPNLTTGQGGVGGQLSDADMVRVLRYGILPDGRSAQVMPSDDYQHLSDADLAAIIAYVRSVPPQDSNLPVNELRPLGRTLLALGQLPIIMAERVDATLEHPAAVEERVSLEYGQYLGRIAGCTGCHGPGLSGGPIPAAPPDWPQAANLTPSGDVGQWTEADFINTIRTGVNPAGKTLVEEMPWFRYRSMTDEELKALWLFIQSVPAQEFGNR
ncbi:MAG: cytochrome C [Caldilinea sp. CFX5]|nr:cytochrome C [Caldilinea sp. CFX5]